MAFSLLDLTFSAFLGGAQGTAGDVLTQLRGSVPKADMFSIYKASPMASWDIGYILDSAHRTKTVVWRCRGGLNKRHQPQAWFPKC